MVLNKKIIIFNHNTVLLLFLCLSLLFDFIDKIYIYNDINFIKFNRILKLIFITYAVITSIYHFKVFYKNIKFVYITLLLLCVLFLLKGGNYNFYKMEFLRYIIYLVSFPILYYVVKDRDSKTIFTLYKFLKYIIYINTILVLLGVIFDVHIFKTYKANRFGFNGLLLSQGFTPYFYLSASVLFWYFKDKMALIITILIGLLSGVKGVYFTEFMVLSLLVFFSDSLSRVFKIRAIAAIFIGFLSVTLIILNLSPFKELLKSHGLLAIIFSHRIEYANELFSVMTKENFNILIGATKLEKVRLELQIVDVLLFFGALGLVTYLYFIIHIYKMIKKNYVATILLFTTLTTSVLLGNFFYIPFASILVTLTMLCLNEESLNNS